MKQKIAISKRIMYWASSLGLAGMMGVGLMLVPPSVAHASFCHVELDRQVACDSANFVDKGFSDQVTQTCKATNGDKIAVRYKINNAGTLPFKECVILDGNTRILPGELELFDNLPTSGMTKRAKTIYKTCNDKLDDFEPAEATIRCICEDDNNETYETFDSDEAGFKCESEKPVCGDGVLAPGEACDDGNEVDGDGCSASCKVESFCGDGVLDFGETCDDGNHISGDGCSATCDVEKCELDIRTFCVAPTPPSTGNDCDGKVVSAVLEYTGDTCEASNNPQEGKAECSGGLNNSAPVDVSVVADTKKVSLGSNAQSLTVGDRFTLVGNGTFGAQTEVELRQTKYPDGSSEPFSRECAMIYQGISVAKMCQNIWSGT